MEFEHLETQQKTTSLLRDVPFSGEFAADEAPKDFGKKRLAEAEG